jgi:hypothetical protein
VNPWVLLRTWPHWRGLEENLRELEQLLRRAGEPALDLAEQVGALLEDPVAVRAWLPADYRLEIALGKPAAVSEEFDMESELAGWLTELARQVADVPALLEVPASGDRLGQALTTELPRMWQGRFGALLLPLRMMRRGGGRGRVGGVEVGAAEDARLPEEAEGWQPRFVVAGGPEGAGGAGYLAVLPLAAAAADMLAASRELLYLLLRDLGVDAARLHLLLTAALAEGQSRLEDAAVFAGLGLAGRRGGLQGRTDRCYAAIRALREVRLSVYRWWLEESVLTYEHAACGLWELKVEESGQARFVEREGALLTRGQDWTLHMGRGSWADSLAPGELLGHQGLFGRILLEELEGQREPLSLAAGVLLAFGGGAAEGEPVAVPNRQIVKLARLEGMARESGDLRRLRQDLRRAVRLQARWGWAADPSGWPREPEEGFMQAVTLFRFAPDLPPSDAMQEKHKV